MFGLEITGRAAPRALCCARCGQKVAAVQLPIVGAKTAKMLNGALSLMLDATVNVNDLSPAVISEAVGLLCVECTHVPVEP